MKMSNVLVLGQLQSCLWLLPENEGHFLLTT